MLKAVLSISTIASVAAKTSNVFAGNISDCHCDNDCPTGRYCMVNDYTSRSDVSKCGPLPDSGCTSYSYLVGVHAGECIDACALLPIPNDTSYTCSGDKCAYLDRGQGPGQPYKPWDLLYLANSCCNGPNTTCHSCCWEFGTLVIQRPESGVLHFSNLGLRKKTWTNDHLPSDVIF